MSPGELDTGKLTIVCAFCFHACVQLLMSVSMPVGHMITLHFVRLNHIFCFIYSICLVLYLLEKIRLYLFSLLLSMQSRSVN